MKKPKTIQEEEECVPLKPLAAPMMVGGNIIVDFNDEEYYRGVEDLKNCVIGKLTLQRRDEVPTIMEIKKKLPEFWKINDLKFIPLGRGTFHILLSNLRDQ